MIDGLVYKDSFYKESNALFAKLLERVAWDERMKARKTASFGVAYNYSQISYPHQEMLPELVAIKQTIREVLGFEPNNCLINLYEDGQAKMGYHSDQTDILVADTGIAILSLGSTRILRFRRIADKADKVDLTLPGGSLVYMTQEVQDYWQHAIPKSPTTLPRMSLTFRKMKTS